MLIQPATLRDIQVGLDLRFNAAYQAVTPLYPALASEIPSNARSTTYPIHARIPKLRQWVGARQVQNAQAYRYSLTNGTYELTVGIPRTDIEDDQIGTYNATIDDMGQQSRLWPDDLLFAAIIANGAAYDSVAYFSAAHTLGGNAIANTHAGRPLTPENYGIGRREMMEYCGEDGESLRVSPDVLLVSPANETMGRKILLADNLPSSAGTASESNVFKGTARLIVAPQLSTAAGGADDTWYLLSTQRPVKPFVFQLRSAPQFVSLTNPSDANVFWQDEFDFGVRARGAAGYGPFWLCARFTI